MIVIYITWVTPNNCGEQRRAGDAKNGTRADASMSTPARSLGDEYLINQFTWLSHQNSTAQPNAAATAQPTR
jgi:hypothetical protein